MAVSLNYLFERCAPQRRLSSEMLGSFGGRQHDWIEIGSHLVVCIRPAASCLRESNGTGNLFWSLRLAQLFKTHSPTGRTNPQCCSLSVSTVLNSLRAVSLLIQSFFRTTRRVTIGVSSCSHTLREQGGASLAIHRSSLRARRFHGSFRSHSGFYTPRFE